MTCHNFDHRIAPKRAIVWSFLKPVNFGTKKIQKSVTDGDKICMMMTRLACNRAIESSYWRMDNDSDVGLLMGYVLYRLPVELEFMDLDTFPR
jgi:hypothetical protein